MKGIIFLMVAILFEVVGSVMLKLSNGFTVLLPTLAVGIGYLVAFTFFSFALKTIPLSIGYAVWSGLGTILTTVLGIFLFNESTSILKFTGLTIVIIGIMLLGKHGDGSPASN
ncbi:DMT family transporter [Oceanobacillus saliphilus]|uniref:DMT family transporter n=1 Tax=Oceanobacillus saliphilus TaxID=2925834 RepID=UPI00201E61BD|nr:multidrug efflux SMR transporter [Oceanobacillus saliphilus]